MNCKCNTGKFNKHLRVVCMSDVPLLIIFETLDTQCAKILIKCSVNEIVSIMVFELTHY